MVLMNAIWDLSFPHPATPQLVAIAALIHQNVSVAKDESRCFGGCQSHSLNLIETQMTALDVRDP
jgi:hypothetical protein